MLLYAGSLYEITGVSFNTLECSHENETETSLVTRGKQQVNLQ